MGRGLGVGVTLGRLVLGSSVWDTDPVPALAEPTAPWKGHTFIPAMVHICEKLLDLCVYVCVCVCVHI